MLLPRTMFRGADAAQQQYRRVTDDQMFTVASTAELPCEGTQPCAFEPLPQGGDYITINPKGYVAPTTQPAPTQQQTVAMRSFKDVMLEALGLGMMGGGAVMFGYGLGKPKAWAAIGGLALVFAGAGLRVAVLTPWFVRAKDALLAPGMTRTTP